MLLRALSLRTVSSGAQLGRLRAMHGYGAEDDKPLSSVLQRIRDEIEADKKLMKWRTRMGERPGDWNSKFQLFSSPDQNSDFIVMMQEPIDLSPASIKRWWVNRRERIERHMQQYIPQRHEILGTDLASAHFLLYRGGAVKFTHDPNWMRANEDGEFDLPAKFDPRYKVEGLRCDNMTLYYEGLENLRGLQYLKFLSFHNVTTFDDWCLDRCSGSNYPKIEVLDISGTQCTVNGLACLYRLPTLKLLIVDDPKKSIEYELSVSMLQEVIPALNVVEAESVHITKAQPME